ncbi:sulfite exporter TauE/SafE family protein [Aliagarivorans marinus]|uniref:sulfite exporter TauE/SafE family protein n=1 Tax=Aliagarivorans marinus TaxID=561965 RepID=UPI00047C7739|nr:sulfite exporter TauE/SafE family protein [Aliagarivorans marinus]
MISLAAFCLVFLGALVQYTVGFGMAVVAAPLLFLLSPIYVPGPLVILALVVSILSSYENRKNISLGGLKAALIGRLPGSIVGGVLLTQIDVSELSLWLGVAVLIAVVISLLPFRVNPTPRRLAVAGFLSGFMGTSTSIGGPPMALLMQHQQADLLRANLAAFFLASSLMSLAVQIPTGYMSWQHLMASLPLIPAVILASRASKKVRRWLPPEQMRYWSLGLCAISGLTAIIASF